MILFDPIVELSACRADCKGLAKFNSEINYYPETVEKQKIAHI